VQHGTVKQLLIIWHSRTGGTEQMARAAAGAAATENGTRTILLPAAQTEAEDLLAADGYIFATPENLAALTGVTKEFFDRSYYPVLGRIEGRPYASLICAGSDGENAARQIARIATGWRLRAVAAPLIIRTGAQTPEAIAAPKSIPPGGLEHCAALGLSLAAGLAMGVF
jgi:multimeric flavodoxin WrbA